MNLARKFATLIVAFALVMVAAGAAHAQTHVSKPFAGAKVNGGTVTHAVQGGKHILTLSGDFKVPDTPDPHWRLVDTEGRVYLLDRLGVKNLAGLAGDKVTRTITLPAYVGNIAKVQIYCAWAEAVLGETTFDNKTLTLAR